MLSKLFKKLEEHLMDRDEDKNELLVLTTSSTLTPTKPEENKVTILYQYAAYVDLDTNVYSKEMGRLAFVFDNVTAATEHLNKREIENLQLYHIKYSSIEETPLGKAYVVEKVLGSGNMIQHAELENLLYTYKNPAKLESSIGEFTWDANFKNFRAKLKWVDADCTFALETSKIPDEKMGYGALKYVEHIYDKRDICDANLREFIMTNLEERNIKSRFRGLEIDNIDVDCEGKYCFHYTFDMIYKINVCYHPQNGQYGINIINMQKVDPNDFMNWKMFKL